MKISELAGEARLFYHERRDALRALEEAISSGRSKRPLSDLASRRSRLPAARAIAVGMQVLADMADELPAHVREKIERDTTPPSERANAQGLPCAEVPSEAQT